MNAQQLKNAILQEAIEGRLVPQDPNDEPASVLLERIRKEKEELVKAGKLKKKDLEVKPISEDEIPFEIPESWEWVKINSVLLLLTDGTHNSPPSYPSGDYLYITAKNIKTEGIDLTNVSYVSQKVHDEIYSRCNPEYGDILYIKDGATAGVVTINNLKEPFSLLSSVALLKQSREMDSRYLLAYLNSSYCYNTVRSSMKGAAITRITLRMIQEWLIPVPPIEEQRRIASKVDSLLPKIKEYGKAQDALNKLNAELPERLKKSILQEAIEGRLVPQDPNDEPASVLLAKIRKEKEQLVKEGKLKKKDLIEAPISEDEIPFDIPDSWEWCRLNNICIFLSRGKSPSYSDIPNEYPVFAQKCNLKEGGISLEQARFLKPETVSKWQEEYHLRTDDILVNSTGTGTVCRTRLFHESYLGKYPFTVPDSHVSVVRTADSICSAYIYHLFNSKIYQDYWEDRLAGSTNQKELYIGVLQNTIIPLPPLTEQRRIVEKLEQLLGEIDKLKK